MSRTVAGLLLVSLLVAAAAVAGTKEIRVQLFLEPDLELEGSEKILIGPVLIEPRLDDPGLRVVETEDEILPPSDNPLELIEMNDFWSDLGQITDADYIVAATIDVKVLDRAGYTTEEYVSPADGKTYFRQVLVEETGFKFDVLLLIFEGDTGEMVFEEQISDFKEREERKLEAYADMFDNLYNLQNRLLGVFVPRSVLAKRTLYTDVD
jgi:hypothetical protein